MTTAWPEVRLGDVVVEARSGFASGHDLDEGVFQFRMNNLTRDGHFDLSKRRRVPGDTKNIDSFLLRSGDVLFNATNSPELVGKSACIGDLDEPAVFSNHFLRIRVDTHRLAPRFLWRWLQLQWQRGLFRSRARQWVNQAAYTREALVELQIPLPPIEEQRRITAVLDQADELRAKRRCSLALLDSLNESMFLDMFGDCSIDRRGEMVPLGSLTELITKGTTPTSVGLEFAASGVPFLRAQDLVDEMVDPRQVEKFISYDSHRSLRRSVVRPNDVLLSIAGTLGRSALVPSDAPEMNCNQAVALIRCGAQLRPDYLAAWFKTGDALRQIAGAKVTATISNLSLGVISRLLLPVPRLEDQLEFERRVHRARAVTHVGRAAASELDSLFSSLQHRAFTGPL